MSKLDSIIYLITDSSLGYILLVAALYLIAWPVAIVINRKFVSANPGKLGYKWGYIVGLVGVINGLLLLPSENKSYVIMGFILTLSSALVLMRDRFAWVALLLVYLALDSQGNLGPTVINLIYLKNRWKEFKGLKENSSEKTDGIISEKKDISKVSVAPSSKLRNNPFNYIEKPKEVVDTLEALERIEAEANNFTFKMAKKNVEKIIKSSPQRLVKSINEEGNSPEYLALFMLGRALEPFLCSGQYHVYRGVLGIEGQEMLKLWDFIMDRTLQAGYHSQDQVARDKNWIREQIKEVG